MRRDWLFSALAWLFSALAWATYMVAFWHFANGRSDSAAYVVGMSCFFLILSRETPEARDATR